MIIYPTTAKPILVPVIDKVKGSLEKTEITDVMVRVEFGDGAGRDLLCRVVGKCGLLGREMDDLVYEADCAGEKFEIRKKRKRYELAPHTFYLAILARGRIPEPLDIEGGAMGIRSVFNSGIFGTNPPRDADHYAIATAIFSTIQQLHAANLGDGFVLEIASFTNSKAGRINRVMFTVYKGSQEG